MKRIFRSGQFDGFWFGWVLFGLLFWNSGFGQSSSSSEKPLLGFSPASAAQERALETRFDAALHKDNLRDWMKRLTARPHHLGSAYDKENADFLVGQFRSWGYEAEIEEFK